MMKNILILTVCMIIVLLIFIFFVYYFTFKLTKKRISKTDSNTIKKVSNLCKTKYPFLLLHGMGMRDFYYFNYWGYIPTELIKNGATIYYGKQDALGCIEHNSIAIKKRILEIISTEKCEKVNIIAHSKGGLEARYVISQLGIASHIASLTTISTPHRGSCFADFVIDKVPYPIFQTICSFINKLYIKIGDIQPDVYTTAHQLTTTYARFFNANNINDKNVYYQSYATVMKHCFSHPLLLIPYIIISKKEKCNDGLVTLSSAQWGHFQKVFMNESLGTSHTDIIALTKNDSEITNIYIEIIKDLKKLGY